MLNEQKMSKFQLTFLCRSSNCLPDMMATCTSDMWDNLVSRLFRDLRLTSIGGGADEVMLGIIGKRMGLAG